MPSSLRSNVLISTVALVLVGLTRPVFNAVVNRTFGPEVNGRAAALIALIFLASLPATAALPTVMVRHLSRALGAGRSAEASGQAGLALKATLVLALIGAAGAVVHARFFTQAALSAWDVAIVAEGVFAYALWRLFRTLLLAIGEMPRSIFADLMGAAALVVLLSAFVLTDRPGLAVQAFLGVYVVYDLLTTGRALRFARGGAVDREGRRSFARYNVLWFVGTASSLAARELALLILDARESAAMVGELSVALSLLTMLAFAPRVIDIPLIHELSLLAGREDRGEQVRLTGKALDWLTVVTLQVGFGAAILAGPILAIVANVHTPVIVQSFAIICFAFSAEMVVTPAMNLLVTESDPSVLTAIGAASLTAALIFWYSPLCEGTVGIAVGLAISHAIKGIAIGWYARSRFGVAVFASPVRKIIAIVSGCSALAFVRAGALDPWIAFAAFQVVAALACAPLLREMLGALRPRAGGS